jgi:hypothetical protein
MARQMPYSGRRKVTHQNGVAQQQRVSSVFSPQTAWQKLAFYVSMERYHPCVTVLLSEVRINTFRGIPLSLSVLEVESLRIIKSDRKAT